MSTGSEVTIAGRAFRLGAAYAPRPGSYGRKSKPRRLLRYTADSLLPGGRVTVAVRALGEAAHHGRGGVGGLGGRGGRGLSAAGALLGGPLPRVRGRALVVALLPEAPAPRRPRPGSWWPPRRASCSGWWRWRRCDDAPRPPLELALLAALAALATVLAKTAVLGRPGRGEGSAGRRRAAGLAWLVRRVRAWLDDDLADIGR